MGMIHDIERDYRPPIRNEEKAIESKRLAADVEAFLRRGGEIRQLEHGETGNPQFNKSVQWHHEKGRLQGGGRVDPLRIRRAE